MPGGPRRWLGWGGQKVGRRTGEGGRWVESGARRDPKRPEASHGGVAHLDPNLVQLGLDTRRTLRRIRTPHVANQLPDRRIDSRSTAPGPAPPTPIGAESLAMPVRDRSWLDENECSAPARPDAPEPHPEESVTVPELDAPRLPTEYRQLLAESDVLKCEIPPTLQRRHEAPVRDT